MNDGGDRMNTYDVVIIGSGPAGLSAAIYAQRARLETLVIEKETMSGGQVLLTYEVDNYPGLPGTNGFELGMKFREHAENLGANFIFDEVVEVIVDGEDNIKKIICKGNEYKAKTIIIATGATHRKLGVKGEDELRGRGVGYCATCDGAFFRNKTTAVIGGGDVALEDAIFLSRMCEQVYLLPRRDALRGARYLQEQIKAIDNISILWSSKVLSINGVEKVESMSVQNLETDEEFELDVDGVFIAVGITPNSRVFEGVVEMEEGYIIADECTVTNIEGVYAAGDVRKKQLRQIVTAVSDGANAITSAEQYILRV